MKAKDYKKLNLTNPKGINKMKLLFKMMFEDILLSLMEFVPDHLKTQEMYNETMRNNP